VTDGTDGVDVVDGASLEAIAAAVAGEAAALIAGSIGRATVTATKSSPTDVVTETDVAAEKLIRNELERRCPGSSVIGEELDNRHGSTGVGWIVDPLDGTVNFSYDLPIVSVSIAATIDGKVVAGAVCDVLRGERFSASDGNGARRDGRPIAVAPTGQLANSLILTGFSYDAGIRAEQAEVLTRVLPAARDIRCMGSAALNLCWVACGRGEAYFERDLKIYDYAAGALIATEAGAVVELPAGIGRDLLLVAAPGINADLVGLVVGT
jgi:myo-inositol-1(or 4)-monophosphatase